MKPTALLLAVALSVAALACTLAVGAWALWFFEGLR